MSRYMNDYDLEFARRRFTRSSTPNRLGLVLVVEALAEWTNDHSDGWAYWQQPRRAADKAMALIESTTNAANDAQERDDIGYSEAAAAVRPIKAFLTRQAVPADQRERILRGVES